MQVSSAVIELERQFREMRERAERAEGIIRVYEARDRGRAVTDQATGDDKWEITWRLGDGEEEPIKFTFSPGLWLLGAAESFLRSPQPFECRVAALKPKSNEEQGE